MGSATDVLSLAEIQLIKNHFAETTFLANNDRVLANSRYASTESVATPVKIVDTNPDN